MTLSKANMRPALTSASPMLAMTMDGSVGHSMANRAETTVEPQVSSNTLITGGSFVTVEEGGIFQNHTTHVTGTEGQKGMRKLLKVMAPGASHNSAERYDPPKCHPKTRKAIIKTIMDWVQGLEDSERRYLFMWLYGPAGAGKSAIAQTIAELCHEMKLLAASFFFSRTATGRNDHSRLISTLAYQLCQSIPEIRTYVEDAIEFDPNIFSLSTDTQLQKLIIEPLSQLHNNLNQNHGLVHPRLIIIDGLDECASANYVQRYVLHILADKTPIPLLFLVASRPEPPIRSFFTSEPMASITTTLILDDSCLPDIDIKVFLKAKFDAIKRDHPLSRQLPKSWPSAADVDHLVRKSSGQFIYASTVMKYVESARHWPTDRLEIVFGIMSRGKDTPFADLDALYTYIFSSVEDIEKVLEVFRVLLLVTTSEGITKSQAFVEGLLGLRSGDLNITLIDLHSILDIPVSEGEIRIVHASLGDFLLDQTRSGDYHISRGHAHANLTRHFMRCIPRKATNHLMLYRLSVSTFTKHCTQSYPTAELMDALWTFNTFAFWPLYFSSVFLKSSSYVVPKTSQLSDFFTWLKKYGSNKDGRTLFSHYILTWDRYMQLFLKLISIGPLESQYLVFLILPQFCNTYQAQDILAWDTIGTEPEYQSLLNISSRMKDHSGDGRYDLLLAEFFSDPSRSGPFYLDGNIHASSAISFVKYLIVCATSYSIGKKIVLKWDRDLFHLSILLSKASYSKELTTLLNSKLLNVIEAQRPDLVHKVAEIAKGYRNNANRIPVREDINTSKRLFRWLGSKFHGS